MIWPAAHFVGSPQIVVVRRGLFMDDVAKVDVIDEGGDGRSRGEDNLEWNVFCLMKWPI